MYNDYYLSYFPRHNFHDQSGCQKNDETDFYPLYNINAIIEGFVAEGKPMGLVEKQTCFMHMAKIKAQLT